MVYEFREKIVSYMKSWDFTTWIFWKCIINSLYIYIKLDTKNVSVVMLCMNYLDATQESRRKIFVMEFPFCLRFPLPNSNPFLHSFLYAFFLFHVKIYISPQRQVSNFFPFFLASCYEERRKKKV